MGRPKKLNEDKKIKVSISMDKTLYLEIKKNNVMPSRIIEKLVKDYYGKKNL
jgi:hypothetical protein